MKEEDLKKLKDFAFQSGYPLENDVQKILGNVIHKGKWSLQRDFVFGASDEENTPKYRTIDFVCSIEYSKAMLPMTTRSHELHARLHFIVECKWLNENSHWWMRPRSCPSFKAETFPFLVPILDRCIDRYEVPLRWGAIVGNSYPIAQSGRKVSLVRSSESPERESLVSYQIQLIQAVIAFLEERAEYWQSSGLNNQTGISPLEVVIPVIATNAPLELLHANITSDRIISAESREDVCHREGCLQLEFPMQRYLIDSVKLDLLKLCNDERLRFLSPVANFPFVPTIISSIDTLPTFIQSRVDLFEEALARCRDEIFTIPT